MYILYLYIDFMYHFSYVKYEQREGTVGVDVDTILGLDTHITIYVHLVKETNIIKSDLILNVYTIPTYYYRII